MNTTDWMARALCRPTQAGWLSEYRPTDEAMAILAGICAQCPVRPQCARYALDTNATGAVYAGVWLPPRGQRGMPNHGWRGARTVLSRLAA